MPADGLEDADVLLDYSSQDPEEVEVSDPGGASRRWLYATGINQDTFTLEYRPNPNRSWVKVFGPIQTGVETIERRPEGHYRVTRDANNDQATIALV